MPCGYPPLFPAGCGRSLQVQRRNGVGFVLRSRVRWRIAAAKLLDTTLVTPGTAAISFIASISSSIGFFGREIEGTRMITGLTAPSLMIGIKDLPRNGYKPNASK